MRSTMAVMAPAPRNAMMPLLTCSRACRDSRAARPRSPTCNAAWADSKCTRACLAYSVSCRAMPRPIPRQGDADVPSPTNSSAVWMASGSSRAWRAISSSRVNSSSRTATVPVFSQETAVSTARMASHRDVFLVFMNCLQVGCRVTLGVALKTRRPDGRIGNGGKRSHVSRIISIFSAVGCDSVGTALSPEP